MEKEKKTAHVEPDTVYDIATPLTSVDARVRTGLWPNGDDSGDSDTNTVAKNSQCHCPAERDGESTGVSGNGRRWAAAGTSAGTVAHPQWQRQAVMCGWVRRRWKMEGADLRPPRPYLTASGAIEWPAVVRPSRAAPLLARFIPSPQPRLAERRSSVGQFRSAASISIVAGRAWWAGKSTFGDTVHRPSLSGRSFAS